MVLEAVIQQLRKENYPAEGISVAGQDKKARLSLTTPAIQNGTVLFPKKGVDVLISQLIGFSKEKYNDLANAFSLLINKVITDNRPEYKLEMIDTETKPFMAGVMDKIF